MELANKVRGGFGLALAFLLLIGLAAWWSTERNVEIFGSVAHSHRILHSLEATQTGLSDLEARARGYFVTGNELYLEDREAAVASVLRLVADLRRLNSDNPAQQGRAETLLPAVEQRLKLMAQYITFRRERGAAEVFKVMGQMKGRLDVDETRRIISEIETEERRLLQERLESAHDINRMIIWVVVFGGLLAVVLVSRAGFGVRRHFYERQRAEESLCESKQQLETAVQATQRIMDHSLDVICTIDAEDRVVSLNAACEKVWGYRPEELLWRKYTDLVHSEDVPGTARTLASIQAGEPIREFENRCLRKDGSLVSLAWSASWSSADKLMFCVARDLTERKRAEQALRASEARYRTLFGSIDEGFCIIEMIFDEQDQPVDYRFLEINPSFEQQTGLRGALGKRMRELAPKHESHWFEIYGRIATTGEPARFQNRAEQLGRWYDVYAFRFGEPKQRQVAILFGDITARKAAEAALQASEENLRVTLQSIGDGVLVTDAEGRVIRLNPAAEQLTGWTQLEATGRPVAEVFRIVNEETRQPAFLPVLDTLATGTIHGLANHTMLLARDGAERPIADSCAPIRSREGAVEGAVLVFRDVTEQRRTERALAKSAAEIRDLYHNSPCGYHSVDMAGVFVAVNDTELAWFGRTREELIGKKRHRDLVTPDTQAAYDRGFDHFKKHGEVRDLEFKIARPDGTVMDMLLNATAVRDADGRLLHSRSTMFDITQRKQAENALRASEENLNVTLQSIGDGVLVTDAAGRIIRLNQLAETLTGWTQAEAMGRPVADIFRIINEQTRQPAAIPVAETLAKGTIHGLANHTVLLARDGTERPIADSCAPIRGGDGRVLGAVLVFRDVTEEKAVEAELRRSRAVLQNLFESAPGLFLVLTPDFTITAVSDAYLNATMTRREAIMGRGLFEVFPDNPDDPAATGTNNLRASLNRVLQSGAPDTMAIQKYDVRRPDGTFEERYWSPVNSPVFGPEHRIAYLIHRVEDVTAFMRQKRATPEDTITLTRMEQMEAEIYRSAQEVRAARDQLEQRVRERTAELAATNRELTAEITAREQSQLALAAAEAKFRTIVEQSLVGIYIIQDDRFVYVNPRMAEILGFSTAELTSALVRDFIVEDDRPLAEENLRRRLQGEVPSVRYQLRMTRRDRAVIHVEVHGARSEFNGRPAIMGTLLDITEQKLTAQRLAAERQLLRTLVDNLPSHIFVKDTNGRYLLSNESHTRLLGATQEADLLGKTVFDFFPPEVARAFTATDEQLVLGGQPVIEREERYVARGGHGWHSATKVPLRDVQGRVIGLVGIRHDITERKRAEEELKFYTASLERSNRELQDFASVASHDLQEPLRKIQAFSDRLKARSGSALDETGRDYLDRMQNAAARMQTLVNDLLTFSRVTSRAQPFVPTDLARVTREVLSDLETRLEQTGGRVELGDLPVIEADATQMRQLLQNLIANALKFHRPDAPPVVEVSCERDGDSVRLLVADNGIGFDEKYLDRIFTIFQRLHGREEYEGTGVGLAVCRKIAHRHNGTITARSQLGQGATFIVTLPAKQVKE